MTSGAIRGLYLGLGPVLSNFFTDDIEGLKEENFCKFSDDSKLSGAVDAPEGQELSRRIWTSSRRRPM